MIQCLSHTFKAFLLDWLMLPSGGKTAIALELVKVFFSFQREMSSGISFHGEDLFYFFTFYFVDEV